MIPKLDPSWERWGVTLLAAITPAGCSSGGVPAPRVEDTWLPPEASEAVAPVSCDENRDLFEYDAQAPLDMQEVSRIREKGVKDIDLTYANPMGGRVPRRSSWRMALAPSPAWSTNVDLRDVPMALSIGLGVSACLSPPDVGRGDLHLPGSDGGVPCRQHHHDLPGALGRSFRIRFVPPSTVGSSRAGHACRRLGRLPVPPVGDPVGPRALGTGALTGSSGHEEAGVVASGCSVTEVIRGHAGYNPPLDAVRRGAGLADSTPAEKRGK